MLSQLEVLVPFATHTSKQALSAVGVDVPQMLLQLLVLVPFLMQSL